MIMLCNFVSTSLDESGWYADDFTPPQLVRNSMQGVLLDYVVAYVGNSPDK